jgi:hypothetical protein
MNTGIRAECISFYINRISAAGRASVANLPEPPKHNCTDHQERGQPYAEFPNNRNAGQRKQNRCRIVVDEPRPPATRLILERELS